LTEQDKIAGRTLSRLRGLGGRALTLALLAPLLAGGLLVWQAWTLSGLLGRAIEDGDPPGALMPLVGLVMALLLARAVLGAIGEQAGLVGAEAVKRQIREALFARLLVQSPRTANATPSGVAAAAIVEQVEALDAYFARYLPAALQAALLPLVFGAIILPLDWVAGLLFLVSAPLIPVFMALVGWGAQIATDRQARREAGHLHPDREQLPRQVRRGRFPLDVRVGGEDDFLHLAVRESAEQLADAQLVRTDAVDRTDGAAKHVVLAAVFAGAFDGGHVLRLFDDTEHVLATPQVRADPAERRLGQVAAFLAEADPLTHLGQHAGQPADVDPLILNDVQRDPLRRLRTDPGKLAQLVDQFLDDAIKHA